MYARHISDALFGKDYVEAKIITLVKNQFIDWRASIGNLNHMKTWLNKNYAPDHPGSAIYGASGLGYVLERDLNANRASRFMFPRFKQQQHECMHMQHAIKVVQSGANTPERRKVAQILGVHANQAVNYPRLKNCADGLRREFIHKRS